MFQNMWNSKVAIQGWSGPCTQPWPLLVLPQQHVEHSNNFSFCKNKNIFNQILQNLQIIEHHWSWLVYACWTHSSHIHPMEFLVILPIQKNKKNSKKQKSATCCLRSCSRLDFFHQLGTGFKVGCFWRESITSYKPTLWHIVYHSLSIWMFIYEHRLTFCIPGTKIFGHGVLKTCDLSYKKIHSKTWSHTWYCSALSWTSATRRHRTCQQGDFRFPSFFSPEIQFFWSVNHLKQRAMPLGESYQPFMYV